MSTRASISYDLDYHLYRDVVDGFSDESRIRDRLWVELGGVDFSIHGRSERRALVTVEIPPAVLKALRAHFATEWAEDHAAREVLGAAAAHLIWCLENELTDIQGAKYAVKKLLPVATGT